MKRSKKFTDKLVEQSKGGIPLDQCQPSIVFARVISIDSHGSKRQSISGTTDWESFDKKIITFEIENDGNSVLVRQTFGIGDIVPELGQWVRGIAVQCQWFGRYFITTHLMKLDEKQLSKRKKE
jgi:hypothetical protein